MLQKSFLRSIFVGATILGLASPVLAADPASCKVVNLSDVGWTDITATTAVTSVVLQGLG